MQGLRKVKVFNDNDFEEIPFYKLKIGDIFMLFESTGEPVLNEKGTVFNKAISKPFLKDNIWSIWSLPATLVARKSEAVL